MGGMTLTPLPKLTSAFTLCACAVSTRQHIRAVQ